MSIVGTETGQPLTEIERCRLSHEEAAIDHGAHRIGQALTAIRDQRLYRETHSTFEAYCQERWGISRSYAHRQIEAAEVAALLPMGNTLPERQARELAPLRGDPDQLREVWDRANEATNGEPTAAAIRQARDPEPEAGTDEPPAKPPAVTVPAADPAAEHAASIRKARITNLRSVLTYLTPYSLPPAQMAEREYRPVLDEFDATDLNNAAAVMTAIADLKNQETH